MKSKTEDKLVPSASESSHALSQAVRDALERTPARLLVGRAGPAYRTGTWLKLREDHALARDAVYAELDLERDFPRAIIEEFGLFTVQTEAQTKAEFLLRPDRGRKLTGEVRTAVCNACPAGADIQVVIGDGLSATAVIKQVPSLLTLLKRDAAARGWKFGRPFVVRHCRVGVLNEIGKLLVPQVVILLIGERPGLATAESLSAYMAYQPRSNHTDANRNLISNIHAHGASIEEAALRIENLAAKLIESRVSGFAVKEDVQRNLPAF